MSDALRNTPVRGARDLPGGFEYIGTVDPCTVWANRIGDRWCRVIHLEDASEHGSTVFVGDLDLLRWWRVLAWRRRYLGLPADDPVWSENVLILALYETHLIDQIAWNWFATKTDAIAWALECAA